MGQSLETPLVTAISGQKNEVGICQLCSPLLSYSFIYVLHTQQAFTGARNRRNRNKRPLLQEMHRVLINKDKEGGISGKRNPHRGGKIPTGRGPQHMQGTFWNTKEVTVFYSLLFLGPVNDNTY